MKSVFLSLLSALLLLIPIKMNAQNITQEIGIITGANYFIWTDKDYQNPPKSQVRPNIGISYQLGITKHFSIKSDFIYKRKETQQYSSIMYFGYLPSEPANATYTSNNLFIPILANWSFGKKTKFFMNFGPSWSVEFNRKYTVDYGSHSEQVNYDSRKYTFLWTAGGGLSVPLGDKLVFNGEVMGSFAPTSINYGYHSFAGIQSMVLVGVSSKLGSGKKED